MTVSNKTSTNDKSRRKNKISKCCVSEKNAKELRSLLHWGTNAIVSHLCIVTVRLVTYQFAIDGEQTHATLLIADDNVAFAIQRNKFRTVVGIRTRRIKGMKQVTSIGVD